MAGSMLAAGFRSFNLPRKSVAFGTAFQVVVPPMPRRKAKIETMKYTDGGTAHTITVMRALALTKITTAIAAAGTAAILRRDPGAFAANQLLNATYGPNATIAANPLAVPGPTTLPVVADSPIATNDWLLIQTLFGSWDSWFLTQATSPLVNADGTVSLTIAAAPTGGIPAGADVFWFGALTSKHPVDGRAHPQFLSGAGSAQVTFGGDGSPVAESFGLSEPLVLNSNNATATGSLDTVSGVYTPY